MGNLEGRMFCSVKNDVVVPLSYCRDVCPRNGECPDRECGNPRWDSWQMRRTILEKRGFISDSTTFSSIRQRFDRM
ncbi:MAG: hypothetical protein NWE83_00840 [Candidatus Bathyarchaeota archaeon]|jgi:hypothetical protein|nr:hypothetical protein [Candidatus Bathyarchaeota archaeon]